MALQFDIDLKELLFDNLSCNTFSERLKKAKTMANYSQRALSEVTGLSLSTINELEAGYRDTISRDTLSKLLRVLDKQILCDDYCDFILNQENKMNKLLHIYDIKELSNLMHVHKSTINRWRWGKYQISREKYNIIQQLLVSTQ